MFYPITGGSEEIITVEGFDYKCQLPPPGYGKNRITGELQHIGIRNCSPKKNDQIWKPLQLPIWWKEKRKKEIKRNLIDPEYFDPECEKIRNKWWLHRLCGEWYTINGKHTYIPPSFWYYLNACPLDIGMAHYRDTDRRFYYVWEYACEDPASAGVTDIERRRMGKTYKSGSILLDRSSIFPEHHGSIQSKTNPDAKGVFLKTVVRFFKKQPDFFRPVYDQSKGVTPTSELRFFQTVIKGKKAEDILDGEELESWIDWVSSDVFALDGTKLGTYIMDEFGKTIECDVWERWGVVRFCLDQDGTWCGKALCTSTIEEMENGGEAAQKLWNASNPSKRDANGRTESGLYWFFLPAYETTFFDKFGMPDVERGKVYYMNQRAGLQNDPRALSSIIRKNPFTIAEAFRIDGDQCLYDSEKLNDQIDLLNFPGKTYTVRGNFVWKNGERDTEVEWHPSKNGRWERCAFFENPEESNRVSRISNVFRPLNTGKFVMGADPFSHDKVEDNRRSDGAAVVKMKFDATSAHPYNNAFWCKYKARPAAASMYYEDMILMACYFGCEVLFESNKNNWKAYFIERGYEKLLMKLPKYPDYGIPGNQNTHQQLAEATEEYILENCHLVFFADILLDWLKFDINKTTQFDLAMASGYTLIADKKKIHKRGKEGLKNIKDYGFRRRKPEAKTAA